MNSCLTKAISFTVNKWYLFHNLIFLGPEKLYKKIFLLLFRPLSPGGPFIVSHDTFIRGSGAESVGGIKPVSALSKPSLSSPHTLYEESGALPRMEVDPPSPQIVRKPINGGGGQAASVLKNGKEGSANIAKTGRKVAYKEVASEKNSEEPMAKASRLEKEEASKPPHKSLEEDLDQDRFPAQEENFMPSKFKRRQSKKINPRKEKTDPKDSLSVTSQSQRAPSADVTKDTIEAYNAADLTDKERHVISEVLNARRPRSRSPLERAPEQSAPILLPPTNDNIEKPSSSIIRKDSSNSAPLSKQAKDQINNEAKKCLEKKSKKLERPGNATSAPPQTASHFKTTNKQTSSESRRSSEHGPNEAEEKKITSRKESILDNLSTQSNDNTESAMAGSDVWPPPAVSNDTHNIDVTGQGNQEIKLGGPEKMAEAVHVAGEREDVQSEPSRLPAIPADLLIPDYVENIADLTVEQLKEHVENVVQSLSDDANQPMGVSMDIDKNTAESKDEIEAENEENDMNQSMKAETVLLEDENIVAKPIDLPEGDQREISSSIIPSIVIQDDTVIGINDSNLDTNQEVKDEAVRNLENKARENNSFVNFDVEERPKENMKINEKISSAATSSQHKQETDNFGASKSNKIITTPKDTFTKITTKDDITEKEIVASVQIKAEEKQHKTEKKVDFELVKPRQNDNIRQKQEQQQKHKSKDQLNNTASLKEKQQDLKQGEANEQLQPKQPPRIQKQPMKPKQQHPLKQQQQQPLEQQQHHQQSNNSGQFNCCVIL